MASAFVNVDVLDGDLLLTVDGCCPSSVSFSTLAGDMVHVPYRGAAPAMTDLIAGQVQVMFLGPALTLEHIRAGKLRALAVTTRTRWEEFPDFRPWASLCQATS